MEHGFCLAASCSYYLLAPAIGFSNDLIPLLQHISCFSQFFRKPRPCFIEHIKKIICIDELVLIQAHRVIDEMLEQVQMLVDCRLLIVRSRWRCGHGTGHLSNASADTLFQIVVHWFRDKICNVAAETYDFLDGGRAYKRILGF